MEALSPDPREQRRQRLSRAERLLDRWLDLFESSLENARPDASKVGELVHLFTICKRILETDQLARKLDLLQENGNAAGFDIYPDLFTSGTPGDADED